MELLKNGLEKVHYDYEDYRAYIRCGHLSNYPNYAADSHWHDDVEFICIRSGRMHYRINDQTVLLRAGEGIFVNARQLHFGYSETREECEFICILLHPELLCASEQLRRQFVQPMLQEGAPYVLLRPSAPWQREVMDEVCRIADAREEETAPLQIQQRFYRIWQLLYEGAPWSGAKGRPDHRLAMVKAMVILIQQRYMDKLSLEDIAASVNVSKNTCLNLFRTYLDDTPGSYLVAYRAKMAADLLLETERTIADIAVSVGFASPSHFTQTFRGIYGCTPRDYRADRWKTQPVNAEIRPL